MEIEEEMKTSLRGMEKFSTSQPYSYADTYKLPAYATLDKEENHHQTACPIWSFYSHASLVSKLLKQMAKAWNAERGYR